MAKVLSIEIGYSFTKICEMDYRTKNPKIYKYVSIPTPQGVVDDGFLSDNADFVAAVKNVLSEKKIRTKQAVFSVTSSKIATREVTMPAVKMNQMGALVRANASDYFPIDLTEYELAHLVLGVVVNEDMADRYKVLVMAAGKNLIAGYERFAENCGLHLIALDYSGNSIYQVMRNECAEDTEMVIKVEERAAIASVIREQTLILQRNVVYGIDDAVQTLMRSPAYEEKSYRAALERMQKETCLKVVLNDNTDMIEEAYDYDENEEVSLAKREISGALAPLISNVVRVVDLYNSKNPDHLIKQIRLVGLGSDMDGLTKLFTNEIGIKTTTLNELKSVAWNYGSGEGNPGCYAACVGAAIAPVGFVNEEKKRNDIKNVNYRNVSVLSSLFFLVASVALVVPAFAGYNEAKTEQMRLQRLETQYAPAEAVHNAYNNMTAFYNEVEAGYKMTEHPNDKLIAFLEELEEKLPAEAEVMEFSSNDKEALITMLVADKEQAAKVIQTLRDFDSVKDVSIGAVDQETKGAAEDVAEEKELHMIFSVVCAYYTAEDATAAEAAAAAAQ